MAQIKYKLGDTTTLGEIIELIIEAVFPDEKSPTDNHRKVVKRIRGAISEAVKQGDLTVINKGVVLKKNLEINAPEFFKWAAKVKKWGLKSKIDGLPIDYTVYAAATTAIKRTKLTASAVVIPGDTEKLEREYVRSEYERLRLEQESQSLKSRLSDCEKELSSHKTRKAAINKKKGRRTI